MIEVPVVTDETITQLLTEGKITPAEFGLNILDVDTLTDDLPLMVRVYRRCLAVLVDAEITPEMLTAFRASLAAEDAYAAELITEAEYHAVSEKTISVLGSKHYDYVPTRIDFGVFALDEKKSRDLLVQVLADEIEARIR